MSMCHTCLYYIPRDNILKEHIVHAQKRELAAVAAAKRKEKQDRRGKPKPQTAPATEDDVEEEVADRPGS